MQKHIFIFFVALFLTKTYAQTVINNPEYDTSTLDGTLTKVELLNDATVLSFSTYIKPGLTIKIPKASFIKPQNSDTKLFATHAEGVTLDEEFIVPENGKVIYTLYFPKVPDHVSKIDFDEHNVGHWEIQGINIKPAPIPNELLGNWLLTNGSNLWQLGFFQSKAIVEKKIWQYESFKKQGKHYKITLKQSDKQLILYAKPNVNNTVGFGTSKKNLVICSLEKTNIPNPNVANNQSPNNEIEILKTGNATYSGIIKGHNENSKEKTGMVYVNNLFSGKQDSHLISIQNDGSFSISFPSYHLQQVYVRFPNSYSSVYVEPNKETWHFINSSDKSEGFFAGDLKELNTDFASMHFLVFDKDYYNFSKTINDLTPQSYKAGCFNIQQQQLNTLDSIAKVRFLSEQAYRLMKDQLRYRGYEKASSYDLNKRTSYKDSANVDIAYSKFITPAILDYKPSIQTSSFSSFINRLRFLRHLREGISVTHPGVTELAELLKNKGVELTPEEHALIQIHETYNKENVEAINKGRVFSEKHQDILRSIGRKFGSLYQKTSEEERKDLFKDFNNIDFDRVTAFIQKKHLDIKFTDEEIAIKNAQKKLYTEEEKARQKQFASEENQKKNKAFRDKYKPHIDAHVKNELQRQGIEKIREYYGSTFTADILVSQTILSTLKRSFTPLSDQEIIENKSLLKQPFMANVIALENEKLKAKIEANKTKTGFIVNDTPKEEADKVFNTITSKYKDKVIFVDFWATWCGPCRSGIERIKSLKENYINKDIAFVYITNPSSPEKTYNNMIPDIKGEHYRLTQDQWNYLAGKFNITGIPHYLLLDKSGNLVKHNTGDLRSPESLKPLLDQYLKN